MIKSAILGFRIFAVVTRLRTAMERGDLHSAIRHAQALRAISSEIGDIHRKRHTQATALCHLFECYAGLGATPSAVAAGLDALSIQAGADRNVFLGWEETASTGRPTKVRFVRLLRDYVEEREFHLGDADAALLRSFSTGDE